MPPEGAPGDESKGSAKLLEPCIPQKVRLADQFARDLAQFAKDLAGKSRARKAATLRR